MKNIVLKDGFAFVYLSKELYRKDLIKKAIDAYNEHMDSDSKEMGSYTVIRIEKKSGHSIEVLAREFMNYVLFLEYDRK